MGIGIETEPAAKTKPPPPAIPPPPTEAGATPVEETTSGVQQPPDGVPPTAPVEASTTDAGEVAASSTSVAVAGDEHPNFTDDSAFSTSSSEEAESGSGSDAANAEDIPDDFNRTESSCNECRQKFDESDLTKVQGELCCKSCAQEAISAPEDDTSADSEAEETASKKPGDDTSKSTPAPVPRGAQLVSATPRCVVCGKVCYPKEGHTINKVVYHKTCFRCSHCERKLSMSSFCQMEGQLYCRTHFKQLFKESGGSYDAVRSGAASAASREKTACAAELNREEKSSTVEKPQVGKLKPCLTEIQSSTPEKPSRSLSASPSTPLAQVESPRDRYAANLKASDASKAPASKKCILCAKTVYPQERISVNSTVYHRWCFRCSHCKQKLSLGSFAQIQGKLFCKTHFKQLFAESGGSYDSVLRGGGTRADDEVFRRGREAK